MRVCVLYGSTEILPDGSHAPSRPPLQLREYAPAHDFTFCELFKTTAVPQLKRLVRQGFEVFLNLCDGAWDEDSPGIEVVDALERLGVAFTGADHDFYEPTREAMKLVCHYLGIAAPRGVAVTAPAQAAMVADRLRFPMIVKHSNSYSSIGLTPSSRVTTLVALEAEIERMVAAYHGALVEEFIDGREFTVLVVEGPHGAQAYAPVECTFPSGETFKHFDLKWIDYEQLSWHQVSDPDLSEELQRVSRELFTGLGGRGYARCDIRLDGAGVPHVLEINPNCAVFYPPAEPGGADVILHATERGHERFLDTIIACALAREQRRRRPFVIELRSEQRGYAMYAAKPIAPGEVITRGEEQPHFLVSRSHARNTWPARELDWLESYAYPLNDEVLVTWSPRPEAWAPINHSCDPNAWLEGLDLVARHPIAPGEEITIEYATFIAGVGAAFSCECGSVDCRGQVSPEDWRSPELRCRYAGHSSAYVAFRWETVPAA